MELGSAVAIDNAEQIHSAVSWAAVLAGAAASCALTLLLLFSAAAC